MQKTIRVCPDCHRAIHALIPDEKKLGRDFNTLEKLLAHEKIATYVAWIANKR